MERARKLREDSLRVRRVEEEKDVGEEGGEGDEGDREHKRRKFEACTSETGEESRDKERIDESMIDGETFENRRRRIGISEDSPARRLLRQEFDQEVLRRYQEEASQQRSFV